MYVKIEYVKEKERRTALEGVLSVASLERPQAWCR
jgi:hypothetical protein